MKRFTTPLLVLAALLGLSVFLSGTAASPGSTERVSVNSTGSEGDAMSHLPTLSADGRYVAFASWASNLVADDTNDAMDIFVRDRQTGAAERLSIDSGGDQGNGNSDSPSISADGRYVAFGSYASNIVSGDTNGLADIFVHDREAGTTERVSVDSVGSQANGESTCPSISADGRYVAFHSHASNLVPGDTNTCAGYTTPGECPDVFVHDRQASVTVQVSVGAGGSQANGESDYPSISADGRYVAFMSGASNLVADDTNECGYSGPGTCPDIFVHDRQAGGTERVSVDSLGNEANSISGPNAVISADGRYVAFRSFASNLVTGDTNGLNDMFLHDRQAGMTERVSVDSGGNEANGDSGPYGLAVSADGRYVAFESMASNLVPGDTNVCETFPPPDSHNCYDIFVRDRQAGMTERVSVDSAGNQANGDSYYFLAISGDGRYVAFGSDATNLVPGDTNEAGDVFVHDRGAIAPVGGIAELPDMGGAPGGDAAAPGSESGRSLGSYPALGGGLAAVALALTAGAWYAMRRWLSRRA